MRLPTDQVLRAFREHRGQPFVVRLEEHLEPGDYGEEWYIFKFIPETDITGVMLAVQHVTFDGEPFDPEGLDREIDINEIEIIHGFHKGDEIVRIDFTEHKEGRGPWDYPFSEPFDIIETNHAPMGKDGVEDTFQVVEFLKTGDEVVGREAIRLVIRTDSSSDAAILAHNVADKPHDDLKLHDVWEVCKYPPHTKEEAPA